MTVLDHALHYGQRGWRVAPVAPGSMHPRLDAWQTEATTDQTVIRRWWTDRPDDGISIVTGVDSGIFVVDVDPRHGGDDTLADLEHEHGPLPDTVEAVTGSGGRHLLFRMPAGVVVHNSAGTTLGPGLDVRGEGGQVLAAPTVSPKTGRTYEWEVMHSPLDGVAVAEPPGWLIAILTEKPEPRRPRALRGNLDGDRPGDIFERDHTWPELLEPDGWTLHSARVDHRTGAGYELWTRPGKTTRDGASASLYYGGSDVLKVFTSSAAPLQPDLTYTRWGYHVTTRHGGDYEAAAREARRQLNATTTAPPSTPAPPAPPAARERPAIVHNGRQLDDVVAEAVTALVAANQPPSTFVRAGQLARLRPDEDARPLLETLGAEHMRLQLADAATWWKANKDGDRTATPPPLDVARSVLARRGWPMPALAGVVELPVLRPDGTFHVDDGYDPCTRLYHWHRGNPYSTIPDTPSPAELAAAVAKIDDVLADFPWDTSADRANAWALILTPLVRAVVGQVPMALVDAPEPGTGKGLLVKIATLITMGRVGSLMAWPTTEEELEKKVTATLMAGTTMVIFDNVEGTIRSATLAAVLTADSWSGRTLGRSEMVSITNRATWAATGNNVDVGGDLARRCYRIRLDARQAQPWKRTGFRHTDLEHHVATHRNELLHALATIVRSWWTAGRPLAAGLSAMGGYTTWVRTIGGILDHAGVHDFLANLADFHAQADHDAQTWDAFLTTWKDNLGADGVTVGEVIARMDDTMLGGLMLRDALPDELAGHWGTSGFSRRLSLALRKRVGRHYGEDGLHLVEMPRDRRKVAVYAVTDQPSGLPDAGDAGANSHVECRVGSGSTPATPASAEVGTTLPRPDHTDDQAQQLQHAGVRELSQLPHVETSDAYRAERPEQLPQLPTPAPDPVDEASIW